MSWVLVLKDLKTGETQDIDLGGAWTDPVTEYCWTEGNFACDCNRHLFFMRAQGIEPPEDEDRPCGDDQYIIVEVRGPNGERLTDIEEEP